MHTIQYQAQYDKYLTQLSGFSYREMNNPLALFELAARVLNISAGHIVKWIWPLDDFFPYWIFIVGADVKIPNWLKQRKSPSDHPFRS